MKKLNCAKIPYYSMSDKNFFFEYSTLYNIHQETEFNPISNTLPVGMLDILFRITAKVTENFGGDLIYILESIAKDVKKCVRSKSKNKVKLTYYLGFRANGIDTEAMMRNNTNALEFQARYPQVWKIVCIYTPGENTKWLLARLSNGVANCFEEV